MLEVYSHDCEMQGCYLVFVVASSYCSCCYFDIHHLLKGSVHELHRQRFGFSRLQEQHCSVCLDTISDMVELSCNHRQAVTTGLKSKKLRFVSSCRELVDRRERLYILPQRFTKKLPMWMQWQMQCCLPILASTPLSHCVFWFFFFVSQMNIFRRCDPASCWTGRFCWRCFVQGQDL